MTSFLGEACASGVVKYDLLNSLPIEPPSLAVLPILKTEQFVHSKPMVDEKKCWIKQEFVKKWTAVTGVAVEFKAFMEKWNKARSPAESLWKGEAKRPTPKPDESQHEGESARGPPTSEGQARTLTEARAKYGSPTIIQGKNPIIERVIFPASGPTAVMSSGMGSWGT